MGSVAYGVSSDSSDVDVYGICMPPKDVVFPHLAGEISGLRHADHALRVVAAASRSRTDGKTWGVIQISRDREVLPEARDGEINPNIIDSIFTPRRCVLSSTAIGEYIREHRIDFLHKGAWHKFKGYAYSQLNKIRTKAPTGKRAELVEQHGYDVKFAYHVVRLLLEVEQILVARDIDLERDREQLKAIRRGEWTLPQLEAWAQTKEQQLETLYNASDVPYAPDEPLIRRHLMHCLEAHYGDSSVERGRATRRRQPAAARDRDDDGTLPLRIRIAARTTRSLTVKISRPWSRGRSPAPTAAAPLLGSTATAAALACLISAARSWACNAGCSSRPILFLVGVPGAGLLHQLRKASRRCRPARRSG